jgi:hypothetical protein
VRLAQCIASYSCNRVLERASHITPLDLLLVEDLAETDESSTRAACERRTAITPMSSWGFPCCVVPEAHGDGRGRKVSLEIIDTTPQLVNRRIHSVYISHRIYDFLQRPFIQDMEAFVRCDL